MTHPAGPKLNQSGFTLIEIIAVLVILSVMASVVVKKLELISTTADQRGVLVGVTELNAREMLEWTNQKFTVGGYGADGDEQIWGRMDTSLGPAYDWISGPNRIGNSTLEFGSVQETVSRTVSDTEKAARWRIN